MHATRSESGRVRRPIGGNHELLARAPSPPRAAPEKAANPSSAAYSFDGGIAMYQPEAAARARGAGDEQLPMHAGGLMLGVLKNNRL